MSIGELKCLQRISFNCLSRKRLGDDAGVLILCCESQTRALGLLNFSVSPVSIIEFERQRPDYASH